MSERSERIVEVVSIAHWCNVDTDQLALAEDWMVHQ